MSLDWESSVRVDSLQPLHPFFLSFPQRTRLAVSLLQPVVSKGLEERTAPLSTAIPEVEP